MEMGTIGAVLFCLYLGLSAVNITSRYRHSKPMNVATKPLLLPVLAGAYLVSATSEPSLAVVAALLSGALGDSLLLADHRRHPRVFIFGMASFMIGHACYFIWFLSISTPLKAAVPWIAGSIGAGCLTMWFRRTMTASKHPLSKALSAYCLLIDLLIVGSLMTWNHGPLVGTILCFTGALLFCLSDLFIAMDIIQQPIGDAGSIMTTYLAAQLLMVLGILVLSM